MIDTLVGLEQNFMILTIIILVVLSVVYLSIMKITQTMKTQKSEAFLALYSMFHFSFLIAFGVHQFTTFQALHFGVVFVIIGLFIVKGVLFLRLDDNYFMHTVLKTTFIPYCIIWYLALWLSVSVYGSMFGIGLLGTLGLSLVTSAFFVGALYGILFHLMRAFPLSKLMLFVAFGLMIYSIFAFLIAVQGSSNDALRAEKVINYVKSFEARGLDFVVAHDNDSVYLSKRYSETLIEITESFEIIEHEVPEDYAMLFSDQGAYFYQFVPTSEMEDEFFYPIYRLNDAGEFEYFMTLEFENASNFYHMSYSQINGRNVFLTPNLLYYESEDGYVYHLNYNHDVEFTDTYFGVRFDEEVERFVAQIEGDEDHRFALDAFGYGRGSIFALDETRLYSTFLSFNGSNQGVYLSFSEDLSDASFQFHAAEGFHYELYGYQYVHDEVIFYNTNQERQGFIEIYDENHDVLLRHDKPSDIGVYNNAFVMNARGETFIAPLSALFTYSFTKASIVWFNSALAFFLVLKIWMVYYMEEMLKST